MGGAILAGLLKSGFDPNQISVTTKSAESADRLTDELGVLSFAMENGEDANQMAVAGANVVLVGVKPAQVVEVLADVADTLNDNALVISVAAGVTTDAKHACAYWSGNDRNRCRRARYRMGYRHHQRII
ncbi:MAG: hypothetical protein RL716_1254 [Actinomycetota bacterium]